MLGTCLGCTSQGGHSPLGDHDGSPQGSPVIARGDLLSHHLPARALTVALISRFNAFYAHSYEVHPLRTLVMANGTLQMTGDLIVSGSEADWAGAHLLPVDTVERALHRAPAPAEESSSSSAVRSCP